MASASPENQNNDFDSSLLKDGKTTEDEIDLPKDFEPGASSASVLLSTRSFEEENVSDENFEDYHRKSSCISEIEKRVSDVELNDSVGDEPHLDERGKNKDELETKSEASLPLTEELNEDECDELNDPSWKYKKNHIFILSEAGKPIYSRSVNIFFEYEN
ncbi:UNVERIFIED_CONTAM: hypothetical protein NCL1_50544 [Trichonephila clavipes]